MSVFALSFLGLPVIIVVVTLAATLDQYKAQQHCWLNLQSYVIWAFAGPVLFVLAVSISQVCSSLSKCVRITVTMELLFAFEYSTVLKVLKSA